MTDDRVRMQRTSTDAPAPALDQGPRQAAQPPRKRRGVAGGRIAAAGIGIAAMLGLVANMEVANGQTPAKPATDPGPLPSLNDLRGERNLVLAPVMRQRRIADAAKARPIVLTPHTVVHTVGGGSSGGGSSASYSSGYSAPAAAAAPVASSGGSR
jgi:hypothetical protein